MKRLWLALAIALAGCGDSVVDGSCADGYVYCNDACRPAALCSGFDATTDSAESGSDSGDLDSGPDVALDATDDTNELSDAKRDARDTSSDDVDPGDAVTDVPFDAPDTCPAPPYTTDAHCGACGLACSGATPVCKPQLDGTHACAPICEPPTTFCAGKCVDLDVDPEHCGACGRVCASGICNGGTCRGARAGHDVVIGHDFVSVSPGLAVAKVLVNATFIPSRNPVRVLSYEQYADSAAAASVKAILDAGAAASGRTYVKTATTTVAAFRDSLLIDDFDTAIILDQSGAPAGALATIGTDMSLSLESFVRVGGVVIVLDGGTGTGQMPQFLTAAGILATTGHTAIPGKPLNVVAPGDAVGIGVLSPYSAPTRSVTLLTTEMPSGSLVTVVQEPMSSKPVVLHKVVFK